MNTKKALVLLLAALLLFCTGCFGGEADDAEVRIFESDPSGRDATQPGEVISYTYPADPPKALKNSLDKAAGALILLPGKSALGLMFTGNAAKSPFTGAGNGNTLP